MLNKKERPSQKRLNSTKKSIKLSQMVAFSCNRLRNPPRQLNKLSSVRRKLFTLPALSFKVSKLRANHQLKAIN